MQQATLVGIRKILWNNGRKEVTVQQVCAFTALTVRKLGLEGKNPIGIADLEWIFARNCEGTEQLRKELYRCLLWSQRAAAACAYFRQRFHKV